MATKTGNRHQARKRLPDGTRIAGYGKTEAEANQDLERKLRLREAEPIHSMPLEQGTLHDVAKAIWYARIEGLKPLTKKKYIGVYVNWIRPAVGHLDPKAVTVHDVQQIVNEVREKRSARSATFAREIISQVLKCALDMELVTRNVASIVKSPPMPEKRERFVDVEEARSLLESVKGTDMSAPVFLALCLGLRRGEACGLKWSDLNRQTGELRIVRQRQAIRPHGVQEVPLKTTGSKRVLRLPPSLVAQIDARGNLDSEYICTYRGEPWVPDTITEKWAAIRPKSMRAWTYHDLRHGAAGLLYAAGCSVLEIAEALGHRNPNMTVLYTAIGDKAREKTGAYMGAALFE